MGLTQEVANYVFKLSYKDIPSEIIHLTRGFILDGLGVALAGSTDECSRIEAVIERVDVHVVDVQEQLGAARVQHAFEKFQLGQLGATWVRVIGDVFERERHAQVVRHAARTFGHSCDVFARVPQLLNRHNLVARRFRTV